MCRSSQGDIPAKEEPANRSRAELRSFRETPEEGKSRVGDYRERSVPGLIQDRVVLSGVIIAGFYLI